jgi:hypothetical protein
MTSARGRSSPPWRSSLPAPRNAKRAHQGHRLRECVCRKQGCGEKLLQLQAKPSGGAPPRLVWTRTCSKSEASKHGRPISCAATRKLRTFSKYWNADSAAPSAWSTESAAVFTTTCTRTGTVNTQLQRRRERTGQITSTRSACLRDGTQVDPVKRAAEDLAVAEAEAELLLGRLLRKIARGNRPHRAAQPPRRLVPPPRCTHQLTRRNKIQETPRGRARQNPGPGRTQARWGVRTAPASSALRDARSRSLRRHPCCRSTSSTTAAAENDRIADASVIPSTPEARARCVALRCCGRFGSV